MKYQLGNFFALFLSLCISIDVLGAHVPVGAGGYLNQIPAGQTGPTDQAGNPVTPKVSSNFNQVPNTNNWDSSLFWQHDPANPWSGNIYADPLTLHAIATGLEVGYEPTAAVTPDIPTGNGYDAKEYHHNPNFQLTIGVVGLNSPNTVVDSYGDWSVTALWQNGGTSLKATFGHGIPYVFCDKTGGDAVITTVAAPTIWSNNNGVLGITVNGRHYGIFGPAGSTWNIAGNTLQSSLNGQTYFSIAILPNNSPSTLELYRLHGYSFITNTRTSWSYDEANAELVTTYNFDVNLREAGNLNHTLWAIYRHQWLYAPSASFESFSYNTSRGEMKVTHAGTSFTTRMKFNGILPELPFVAQDGQDTFSNQQLQTYVDEVFNQSPEDIFSAPDTYFFGKALGRVARLVFIADQIGHTQARDHFLNQLKIRLESWLDGNDPRLFAYDPVWKTLIGYPASFGSNNELNDHHFHYGYFIMAAATVAHYDPAWASQSQWGGMVELLIKDVSNWDRNDTMFPFLRSFDPYAGHSWANGPALFGAGNNQESSSEAMNYAAGVILWGLATHNTTLRDLGIYLYTNEVRAIEEYWFDVQNAVFPTGYDRPTVGILWGNGAAYALFFGAPVEGVHGINFLPITGGSLYLGRNPNYLQTNQTYMASQGGGNDFWRDIHMEVTALYNPTQAIQVFNNGYTPEGGESRAHTYYWIHNLNLLGQLDTSVSANYPSAAVFTKNGDKHYVAYNHDDTPRTVTFSDGQTLTVQPHSFELHGIDAGDGGNNGGGDNGGGDNGGGDNGGGNNGDGNQQERTIIIESFEAPQGLFNFNLIASGTIENVILHYAINGGTEVTSNLSSQDNLAWQTQVQNLQKDDIIQVHFTYQVDSEQFTTNIFRYIYGGSCEVCPECPECPTPTCTCQPCTCDPCNCPECPSCPECPTCPSCDHSTTFSALINCQLQCVCHVDQNGQLICECQGICLPHTGDGNNNGGGNNGGDNNGGNQNSSGVIDEGAYTREIVFTSPTQAVMRFAPKSPVNWVDLHYIINNGAQQNVRMINDNGVWIFEINNFQSGDQLQFFFTYEQGTAATDTALVTYTRP